MRIYNILTNNNFEYVNSLNILTNTQIYVQCTNKIQQYVNYIISNYFALDESYIKNTYAKFGEIIFDILFLLTNDSYDITAIDKILNETNSNEDIKNMVLQNLKNHQNYKFCGYHLGFIVKIYNDFMTYTNNENDIFNYLHNQDPLNIYNTFIQHKTEFFKKLLLINSSTQTIEYLINKLNNSIENKLYELKLI